MMADRELIALITHGREERNLEYKGPIEWGSCQQRLTKCIMAFANIRDGGAIVVGVAERPKGTFTPRGLSAAERDSFTPDEVARYANRYADPFVETTLRHVIWDGMDFVVIQVTEFDHIPVICRTNGSGLREGAIYTRTRRVYESAEVPGQAEMREIIDMATEKGRRYLAGQVSRAGYGQAPDLGNFDDELRGL